MILRYKPVSGVVHFEKSFVLKGNGSVNYVVYF